MKRKLSLICVVMAVMLALCACSGKSKTSEQTEAKETVSEEKADAAEETAAAEKETVEENADSVDEAEAEPAESEPEESEPESAEEPEASSEDTESEETEFEESSDSGEEIDPDIKKALDSYEAFMDEYIEFMEKYADADSTEQLSMLGDYSELMTKYADAMDEIDNMDTDSMNDAELKYYVEVTTRVSQKLANASIDMS